MAANVSVKFVSSGFHEVINQTGVGVAVRTVAQDVASKAGHGATVRAFRGSYGGGRPVAIVRVRNHGDEREFATAKKALEGAV